MNLFTLCELENNPKPTDIMNFYKSILSAFIALFVMVPAMGAVTAYSADFTTFDNTRTSSAVWRADVRYGIESDTYKEFGINNGSTLSYSYNHNVWAPKGYDRFTANTVTMGYHLAFDGTQLTITLGDVESTQTGLVYEASSSQTITPAGSFTTLWFGVQSGVADNSLSFSMINTVINTVPVDNLYANGGDFSGEYFAINEGQEFSIIGQVQWDNPGGPTEYVTSTANFHIFGDNTLASVPEVSSTMLIGIAGFFMLLRRQRK